ncbi:hypothetical protein V5O48_004567 [Marasmius crinis-equi]|uniref:Uncharacterized protein n=1 Tax=Marasmius crinis-equi TaxID=585013 RepID=A0ABR3FPM0_9AGAR
MVGLVFKSLIALSLAIVALAAPAPVEERAFGDRVYCEYVVTPSTPIGSNPDKNVYNAEMNFVLGGQIKRESPSHDVESDFSLWYSNSGASWYVLGGASTSALNSAQLKALIEAWPGKTFPGNVVSSWKIEETRGCQPGTGAN